MHIGDRPLDKDLQDFLLQDDTGADGVFVRDLDLLQDYSPLPKPITVGIAKEEASFEILGIGSLSLLDDNGRIVTFFRVYFAPDCAGNFLGAIPLHSTGWRDRGTLGQRVWEHPAGYQITFRQRAGGYFRAIKPVSIGGRAGLHVRRFCDTEPAPSGDHFAQSPASTAGTSGRVAHGGMRGMASGIPENIANGELECIDCKHGNIKRAPFPHTSDSRFHASRILERLHVDVAEPVEVPSLGGNRYVLFLRDDYSRYCDALLIRYKSEVPTELKG
jgi:hypothetical protein